MRIGVVAPARELDRGTAARAEAFVALAFPEIELVVHPQCFLSDGHFAGPDDDRAAAFLEFANDPGFDAIWFGRGGYGSNRIAEAALADLPDAARCKTYMGYSDAGFLLAGMHKAGLDVAWGRGAADSGLSVARVMVRVKNVPGGLAAVMAAIAANGGNIFNFKLTTRNPLFFEFIVDIEVRDVAHLQNIVGALRVSEVVEMVDRVREAEGTGA